VVEEKGRSGEKMILPDKFSFRRPGTRATSSVLVLIMFLAVNQGLILRRSGNQPIIGLPGNGGITGRAGSSRNHGVLAERKLDYNTCPR